MQDFIDSFFEWCLFIGCIIGVILALLIPILIVLLIVLGLYTSFNFIFG